MMTVATAQTETAELLGQAVAEVARRAIHPELEPFQKTTEELVAALRRTLEEWTRHRAEWSTAVQNVQGSLADASEALGNHTETMERTVRALRSEEERAAFRKEVERLCGALAEQAKAVEAAQQERLAAVLRIEAAIQNQTTQVNTVLQRIRAVEAAQAVEFRALTAQREHLEEAIRRVEVVGAGVEAAQAEMVRQRERFEAANAEQRGERERLAAQVGALGNAVETLRAQGGTASESLRADIGQHREATEAVRVELSSLGERSGRHAEALASTVEALRQEVVAQKGLSVQVVAGHTTSASQLTEVAGRVHTLARVVVASIIAVGVAMAASIIAALAAFAHR